MTYTAQWTGIRGFIQLYQVVFAAPKKAHIIHLPLLPSCMKAHFSAVRKTQFVNTALIF